MSLCGSTTSTTADDTGMTAPAAVALSRRHAELASPIVVMAGEGHLIAHAGKYAERLVEEVECAKLRMIPGQGHLFTMLYLSRWLLLSAA